MIISASMVKELRERTGVGMMDCKKALAETDGDLDKAVELLRTKGQAKADKKAERTAADGIILVRINENASRATLIEINTETDFSARDESFLQFANAVADCALASEVESVENLLAMPLHATDTTTVEEARKLLISKIGENIQIRRLTAFHSNQGIVGSYLHGTRIGVMALLEGTDDLAFAKDIAMHIAASRPQVVSAEDVSQELINAEKAIYEAQALESGKPAEVVSKMVEGRIRKYVNEISLVGQPFIKEPDVTVGQLLQRQKASVVKFVRYEVGEGIEKEIVDFAEEVRAQASAAKG